jgi:hypothetical protein
MRIAPSSSSCAGAATPTPVSMRSIGWRTTVTRSAALVLAERQCVMGPLMCCGLGERSGMMTAVQPCTRHGTLHRRGRSPRLATPRGQPGNAPTCRRRPTPSTTGWHTPWSGRQPRTLAPPWRRSVHQCPDGLLVVDQLAREQHCTGVVDDHDPVMLRADIHTSPQLAHCHRSSFACLPTGSPTDDSADISLNKRSNRRSQSAAREVRASRAASPFKPHPKASKNRISFTRPTRVAGQRNNTK